MACAYVSVHMYTKTDCFTYVLLDYRRDVRQTLAEIVAGQLTAAQLPTITVVDTGQCDVNGRREVVSLNNRRLWVVKQCKGLGLIRCDRTL